MEANQLMSNSKLFLPEVAGLEEDAEAVEDFNMKNKKCPLCYKIVYSDIGNGCLMCGMPLKNNDDKFCSKECKIKYIGLYSVIKS